MDRDTNRPFSRFVWRRIVKRLHTKYYGASRSYRVELMKTYTTKAKKGMRVYLVNGTSTLPAIITNDDPVKSEAQLVSIDAVGREHLQTATFPCSRFTIIEARVWNGKWAGPAGATYACDVIWDYYGISKLSDLTIH
eukprot:1093334-Prymnesium_polylepis.1